MRRAPLSIRDMDRIRQPTPPCGRARPAGRRGVTLIEILIVLVVVAVLAAIAVPRYQAMKDRALSASLRADLIALRSAQEGYFAEHRQYARSLAELEFHPTTPGAHIELTTSNPLMGWTASASAPYAPESGSCFLDGGLDGDGGSGGSGVQCNSYVFETHADQR
jgi:prepilin-type N-terminal cleavage/methylation domain-containing protein